MSHRFRTIPKKLWTKTFNSKFQSKLNLRSNFHQRSSQFSVSLRLNAIIPLICTLCRFPFPLLPESIFKFNHFLLLKNGNYNNWIFLVFERRKFIFMAAMNFFNVFLSYRGGFFRATLSAFTIFTCAPSLINNSRIPFLQFEAKGK